MRGDRRLGGLDILAIIGAVIGIVIITLNVSNFAADGWVYLFDYSFGIVTVCFAVQGAAVLYIKRGQSKVRQRKIFSFLLLGVTAAWALAMTFIYAGWTMKVALFNQWIITMDAIQANVALIGLVWLIILGVALLWFVGFLGSIWLLTRVVQLFLPQYLLDVKSVRFDGKDGWKKRAECWIISFPNMLEPASLRLDNSDRNERTAMSLFKETVAWQLMLGLLLAIYVSFNPMLLSAMSFTEAIKLITIPLGILPLFILPWAILDGLGAKVAGTRRDFYIHEGAKKRMMQTLITFGTLLLILRLAVVQIGLASVVINFIIVGIMLLILSVMASFVYFNYFEAGLLQDIKTRLERKNF